MREPHVSSERRAAFTLIELLVVIAIIMALAGMLILFSPGISQRQQAARGATQVQGALLYAKNKATQARLATGIRLINNSTSGNSCNNILLVQRPDDFTGGTATGSGTTVTLNGVSSGGTAILAGDSLEIGGSGLAHQITNATGSNPTTLTLFSALPNAFNAASTYRVMRAPRLLQGEPPIQLPQDIAVDLSLTTGFINNQATALPTNSDGSIDVLLAPGGGLTGMMSGFDMVCLYVRDMNTAAPGNFPSLIVVYGRTGFIAHQPVNPNGDAYLFAKYARSSGM